MARGAGDGIVRPLQRKFGLAVIERLDLSPLGFAVAIVAFFAKASFMRVVRLMTVEAAPGCLAEFYRWRVTAGARHGLVCIPELEIRGGVIERLPVEQDDVGVSALVIGVTVVAFLLCGIRLAPVKSLACGAIGSNLLVAVETEPRLGFPGERLVAFATLLLQLGMSFDDRPRHHE